MRILITGGAGFIGSNLADRLIARGDDVVIVDNLATGQVRNVHPEAEFHNISLGDSPISPESDILLALDWKSIDAVVHAAASYKDPQDWRTDAVSNVVGTVDLIKAMQVKGVSRLIYFQTALMYGLHPPPWSLPVSQRQEPYGSSYSVSKTAAENYIQTSDLNWISFRLANCYGPRNLSGPVPTFWKKLKAGEECTVMDTKRDFVFVDDLLDLVIMAIDGQGNGAYHVSSGRDVNIADMYYAICEAMGVERPVTIKRRGKDDVKTILLDPALTEIQFNWKASTPLSKGIKKAISCYNEYSVGETYTHLKIGTHPTT